VRARWSRVSKLYVVASVACALMAGLIVRTQAARGADAAAVMGRTVDVVVAATAIERGEAIRADELRVASIPRAYAPPGAVPTIRQAAGRVALTDLSAGEVVTQTRLARVRAGPVASLVPQGLRAFAVPTSLPVGVVRAGDHVDVLATFGGGQPHTEAVVDGVEVLFVLGAGAPGAQPADDPLGLDAGGAGASGGVTLVVLVGPDQEDRLAYARAFGNLDVAIVPAAEVMTP